MKNIIDYLNERKDIPFTEDAFNEVDGLILSELVYVDFSSLLGECSDMDIVEVNRKFWHIHTREEMLASASYSRPAPFMMEEMADSIRYRGMRFRNYAADTSLAEIVQFSAVTFELPDGSDFIAYRGTDGTVVGWLEDLKFSYSTTDGQSLAVKYLNQYQCKRHRPIRIGGHSKGGNLAVYAALFCEEAIRNRVEKVYSYDGPGFKMDVLESEEYREVLPRIVSIVPKDCMVGVMMNNRYQTIVADSDRFSVFQHDAFQWHVVDNHFEQLPYRSELSLFFELELNHWLERFDETKRERILEAFLTLITENEILKEDNDPLCLSFIYGLIINSRKLGTSDKILLLSGISDAFISASVAISDTIKSKYTETLQKLTAVNRGHDDHAKINKE